MGSTYYNLHYHVVFATKGRQALIHKRWRPLLHEYLGGTIRGLDGVAEAIGGVEDHVHLLLSLKTDATLADVVRETKKASSIWAIRNHERHFAWQDGYSAFSLSWSHVRRVQEYIGRQETHHQQVSFADELKRIFDKNGIRSNTT